jgi:C-terminal processing protease CtpA/Prc
MQLPTGRPVTPEGEIVIEGKGVIPDISVPVTIESVLGHTDTLLDAAVQALQKLMK